ncbi:GAF domain-containing protein, partial [bacterium]|nr:GAF domain-containing protein [bacterium]
GRGTPPPEVDEFCAQIKEVLGARAVYFPAAGPPEGEDAPACLARCLAGGDAAFAGEVCECGGRAWEAIIPDLPAACRRILFCGLPVHTSDRLLAFCRQSLARWGENLALHRQAARDHQLWNRFAGQTHFNQLAEEVFAALGERLAVREAAFLVEDDEGRLVPAAGHRIRWSPSQAAALRLSSHRYRERLAHPRPLFTPEPGDPLAEWWMRLYLTRHDQGLVRASDCRCLPILHQDRLIGIIIATLAPQGPLPDPDELAVLEKAIAAGLQNSIVFQSMQKFTTALATIHTIHRLMRTAENPEFLVRSIAGLACEILPARKCAVMLVSEDGSQLLPAAEIGLSQGEIGTFPLHRSDGIPGWIWVNRESLLIDNLAEDHRFQDEPATRYPEPYYLGLPLVEEDVLGVILVSGKDRPFRAAERDLLGVLAEQTAIALSNALLIERQRRTIRRTLIAMTEVLEGPNEELKGITQQVVEWACRLRDRGAAEEVDRENLVYACLLRDAGRLRAPESAPPPSRQAFAAEDRSHPEIALRIIREMGLPEEVSRYVLSHHEAWDGSGYPQGLAGEAIPLGARLLAVAEAFVILTHGRPGRPPMSARDTLRLMRRLAGRMFDPRLVGLLSRLADGEGDRA